MRKHKRLKKDLNLLGVYSLATGATLSAGFFLLPGLAYTQSGPAIVLCYMLAMIPLIPAMFSMVELATAMPRAGGAYYFLDRSMGPLMGTLGGMGTWLALIFKTSFALIGMGAYVNLYFPNMPVLPISITFAILFAMANLVGAKKIGSLQVFLVGSLLAILSLFIGFSIPHARPEHFADFFGAGFDNIISTTGLVYISYVGVTNVASVAEEIKNPEKNLPLGIFLSMITAAVVYGLGTYVIVGVVPPDVLNGNLTPVATSAEIIAGKWGAGLVTIAALFAFFAVANAGILSASRYPLAMSRDHLLPAFFRKFNKKSMPCNGIYATLGIILTILILFDATKIAKLASAFQLLLFAFLCMAVVVMRESKLDSYDPGFHSPFYPWMQIAGILIPLWMITQMGWLPILFSSGLLLVGVFWYYYYAKAKVVRHGAIFHVLERMGRLRYDALDQELREILKEKGLREQDPYDEVIIRSVVLDLKEKKSFEEITREASLQLANHIPVPVEKLVEGFLEGTKVGATPVSKGAALPHVRLPGLTEPNMIVVRSLPGVEIETPFKDSISQDGIYAIFFLVSTEKEAAQHLRILAQLAKRVDDENFMTQWMAAGDENDLKEILLREERYLCLVMGQDKGTHPYIGCTLKDFPLPPDCLVAVIKRSEQSIVPVGKTILMDHDRLTIIGSPEGIQKLSKRHTGSDG